MPLRRVGDGDASMTCLEEQTLSIHTHYLLSADWGEGHFIGAYAFQIGFGSRASSADDAQDCGAYRTTSIVPSRFRVCAMS